MKITIKEIAEIAGVHRATVDKVIHNRPGVSDGVRQRIRKIIDEVGYQPNLAGKILQKQGKVYRLAAILVDVDAEFFLRQGIESGVRKQIQFDIDIEYHITSFQNAAGQSRLIDLAAASGVDGIILSPINSDSVRAAVNRAAEKGIPVVTIDSDLPDSRRLCFVGLNGEHASHIAGRLMGLFAGETGNIAIISSAIGTENNNYFVSIREQGFRRFVERVFPQLHIVECVESFEDPEITYLKTKELLGKYPDLQGIYITCGGVAEVGRALQESGRQNEIRVLGYEDYPEILEMVRANVVDVTLASDLFYIGERPVAILLNKLVFGVDPPQDQLFTEPRILVKESID